MNSLQKIPKVELQMDYELIWGGLGNLWFLQVHVLISIQWYFEVHVLELGAYAPIGVKLF
jgi:hypothetical protein